MSPRGRGADRRWDEPPEGESDLHGERRRTRFEHRPQLRVRRRVRSVLARDPLATRFLRAGPDHDDLGGDHRQRSDREQARDLY